MPPSWILQYIQLWEVHPAIATLGFPSKKLSCIQAAHCHVDQTHWLCDFLGLTKRAGSNALVEDEGMETSFTREQKSNDGRGKTADVNYLNL